jgi:hypothetical protein
MNKTEAYRTLQAHRAGFLANVVLCQHRNPGKRLKKLARLALCGYTVSLGQFSIDALLVNGWSLTWSELEDLSVEAIVAKVNAWQEALDEQERAREVHGET